MPDVFSPQNFWDAVAAIAQGLASIMAIAALIISMTSFKQSLKTSHYTELDRMYFDLLKIALERPHVTNPNADRTEGQKLEYEIYAYMVWNFLETIYDRCERDKHLWDTWLPVLKAENGLHGHWLSEPQNQCKFKPVFCKFISSQHFTRQG
ncbi:MAG: hypothetical protein AABZ84_00795 [Pseudomonadota bacterium]